MLSTRIFNIRLYFEGLKRLKVIGMAVAILSMTVSALIPIIYWVEGSSYQRSSNAAVDLIQQNMLCLPLIGIVFIAPFFFAVLFSFLHKRKQSDFFHAIPYTRTCVYLSFVASALTFIFAIQIVSALIAGILWAVNPYTTFIVGELISVTLMSMLAAAELSAIMMLALSLTGTPMTTMLMFALFTLITRVVVFYMAGCVDSNIDIVNIDDIPFLNFTWFLPFGLFMYFINGVRYVSFNPFTSPANIIYTVIVTVLLFSAAWFFYKIRKSEMAGNTAPNRLAQHIYRILFTAPFALLLPLLFLMDGENVDFSLILVVVVITLLVYYLYELITTKRFKGFGKATLLLPVLVVLCLAFSGSYLIVENAIFANTPDDAEDVSAVSIDTVNVYTGWDDYQDYLLSDSISYDRALIERMVVAMNETAKSDRSNDYEHYFASYEKDEYVYIDTRWMKVTFTLDNGKTVTRRVAFREDEYSNIQRDYVDTVEIDQNQFWALPDGENAYYLYAELCNQDGYEDYYYDVSTSAGEGKDFYKLLTEEYNKLSIDQKQQLRSAYAHDLVASLGCDNAYVIGLNGQLPTTGRAYYLSFSVVEAWMPETFKYLTEHNLWR